MIAKEQLGVFELPPYPHKFAVVIARVRKIARQRGLARAPYARKPHDTLCVESICNLSTPEASFHASMVAYGMTKRN